MRHWLLTGQLALVLAGASGTVLAQGPVAVVEDVRGRVDGVEFMDYVAAGRVIELRAGQGLVLSYMKSCWRETISGGTVTIGEDQSQVWQGKVERVKVACATQRPQLGAREATQSAATVYRSFTPPGQKPPASPASALRVQSLSPLFDVGTQRGLLRVERIDRTGERLELKLDGPALLRGRFFDLALAQVTLSPGATYRATLGERSLEFVIDADPPASPAALLGRLLRFE
ncbi:MAG: hypothetical protein ING89_04765 [Rubrivivax sp.]|nr:hypothetical protein [Rubrivivax sp.]